MKVWTVANQKGGVGKTTSAVSMAGILAGWGFRTLMVDMDPHGSLTGYFKYDPDTLDESVYSLFQAAARKESLQPEGLICGTGSRDLDLLPAAMALATLDRVAGKLDGMGLVLKSALNKLSHRYDFVLVDCPPVLGVLMINALAACERLIIPVQTEFLALKGLERMMHTLDMVLKTRKEPLPVTILPTMFDRRTRASSESLQALRQDYPQQIWRGVIPVDTQFREASKAGLPPARFAPKSRGVLAYGELLQDLLDDGETQALQEMAG
jgi:chromosome partitioning protein